MASVLVRPDARRKTRFPRPSYPDAQLIPKPRSYQTFENAYDRRVQSWSARHQLQHHYIVVSMLTGARTEELRALRWEHVHAEPLGTVPPHIEVWRSVRFDGGGRWPNPGETSRLDYPSP